MAKQKIADLPQEEQEKLISTMKDLKIGGVYSTYTVEKALAAIEKKKAEKNSQKTQTENQNDPGEQTESDNTEEQTESDNPGEQTEGDNTEEQTEGDKQTTEETSDVPNSPEIPEGSDDVSKEGLSDEAKNFLDGKTDKLPADAEVISEDKAKELQKKAVTPARKSEGICHICRSKVYDGVCSGCGFSLRG